MGSVGDAYDNARCESFFATLECELLDRHRFRTQIEARLAIFDFIESWYNPRRRHSRADARDHSARRIDERPGGRYLDIPRRSAWGERSRKHFTVHRAGATPRRRGVGLGAELLGGEPIKIARWLRDMAERQSGRPNRRAAEDQDGHFRSAGQARALFISEHALSMLREFTAVMAK
jgi:hypothetical protein